MKSMTKILTVVFLLFLIISVFGQEKYRSDVYLKSNLYRVLNGEKVDLSSSVLLKEVAVAFKGERDRWGLSSDELQDRDKKIWLCKQQYNLVEKQVTIEKEYQYLKIFGIEREIADLDEFLQVLNLILKEEIVEFASPVFYLPGGPQILTGEFEVKFKDNLSFDSIEGLIEDIGLEIINHDVRIYILRVTKKSGLNVLTIAHSFDPLFGDIRTVYSSPEFIRLESPLFVWAYVVPAESPSSYPGNLVRDRFKYVLSLNYPNDVEVSFNELKVGSEILKNWRPLEIVQGKDPTPISSLFFSVLDKEKVSEPEVIGETIHQEVEYTISISRTGEFLLPSLKVVYQYPSMKGKTEFRTIQSNPVVVKIGSILPTSAPTVNDISGLLSARKTLTTSPLISIFRVLIGLGILWIGLFVVLRVRDKLEKARREKLSPEAMIRKRWDKIKESLLKIENRQGFFSGIYEGFRQILGLIHFEDETNLMASDSSRIEEKLEEKMEAEKIEKIKKILYTFETEICKKESEKEEIVKVGRQKTLTELEDLIFGG